MKSLKDFLAEQGERLQTHELKAAERRDEWVGAVDRLLGRIIDWLREADPGGLLEVRMHSIQIREVGIGMYMVHALSVELGPTEIRIEPIARNVAGPQSMTGLISIAKAYGRVDMTNGLEKFMIFRTSDKSDEDRWIVIEQDRYQMQPFDRGTFESAFQSLLE